MLQGEHCLKHHTSIRPGGEPEELCCFFMPDSVGAQIVCSLEGFNSRRFLAGGVTADLPVVAV